MVELKWLQQPKTKYVIIIINPYLPRCVHILCLWEQHNAFYLLFLFFSPSWIKWISECGASLTHFSCFPVKPTLSKLLHQTRVKKKWKLFSEEKEVVNVRLARAWRHRHQLTPSISNWSRRCGMRPPKSGQNSLVSSPWSYLSTTTIEKKVVHILYATLSAE